MISRKDLAEQLLDRARERETAAASPDAIESDTVDFYRGIGRGLREAADIVAGENLYGHVDPEVEDECRHGSRNLDARDVLLYEASQTDKTEYLTETDWLEIATYWRARYEHVHSRMRKARRAVCAIRNRELEKAVGFGAPKILPMSGEHSHRAAAYTVALHELDRVLADTGLQETRHAQEDQDPDPRVRP